MHVAPPGPPRSRLQESTQHSGHLPAGSRAHTPGATHMAMPLPLGAPPGNSRIPIGSGRVRPGAPRLEAEGPRARASGSCWPGEVGELPATGPPRAALRALVCPHHLRGVRRVAQPGDSSRSTGPTAASRQPSGGAAPRPSPVTVAAALAQRGRGRRRAGRALPAVRSETPGRAGVRPAGARSQAGALRPAPAARVRPPGPQLRPQPWGVQRCPPPAGPATARGPGRALPPASGRVLPRPPPPPTS